MILKLMVCAWPQDSLGQKDYLELDMAMSMSRFFFEEFKLVLAEMVVQR
jgi:hypothetical protein